MTVIPESKTAFPVLYILMRTDLDSMNAGKMGAQTSHASSAFAHEMEPIVADLTNGSMSDEELEKRRPDVALYHTWKTSTAQGFGTVLVIDVDERQMRAAVNAAKILGFTSAVVHDPTYPLRDGDFTHFIPLDTCAYVFGDKNDPMLEAVIGHFELHP